MIRKTILILAAVGLCYAAQAGESVQYTTQDTVRFDPFEDVGQMLQQPDPAYHKGVIVTSPWIGNWFVTVQGGAGAFIGTPIGCADLFDRVKPTLSASLGKWFTPQIGMRISYAGWQFKDCQLDINDYHHFHADLMWNVLGSRYGKVKNPRWGIVPYVGLGVMYNPQNGGSPFAVSYGVQGQLRVCRRLSVVMEIGNVTTFQDFDGYGSAGRLGDNMLSLSAGLSLSFGRTGWNRPVDAASYIRQNECLISYATQLSDSNREYAGQHERDARTMDELKKILEIEGLLDRYGGLFDNVEGVGDGDDHVNNYSGLNSLKARLRNRHWDGKSPLAGEGSQKGSLPTDAGVNEGGAVKGHADGMGVGSLSGYDMNVGEAGDSRAHDVTNDSLSKSNTEGAVAMVGHADDTAVDSAEGSGTDGLEAEADHGRNMDVNSLSESGENGRGDSDSLYSASDYLAFVKSGSECVGSPIYFFFELGTADLTDRSQLVNLDELARVAKKYGLCVTVVGAADAGTGSTDINNALSVSRADYIVTELCRRGVDSGRIFKAGMGGISDYTPDEANRHTKVMLFSRR